jgi:3',5'-cyclic AMP phosphodiesterase CpdA
MRVVQITDLHVVAPPAVTTALLPGAVTLEAGLRHIAQGPPPDLLVLTGDNMHEDGADYQKLRAQIERNVSCPIRAVPGNHDIRGPLMAAFPPAAADAAPAAAAEALPTSFMEQSTVGTEPTMAQRLQFVEERDGWLLIGVDTLDDGASRLARGQPLAPKGAGNGRFGREQAAWLRAALAAHPTSPAVIFMHHPPVPNGVPPFANFGELFDESCRAVFEAVMVENAVQIKAVVCGHIHAEHSDTVGGVPLLASPATYLTQFDKHAAEGIAYEEEAMPRPGYRVFDLQADGVLETHVVRYDAAGVGLTAKL